MAFDKVLLLQITTALTLLAILIADLRFLINYKTLFADKGLLSWNILRHYRSRYFRKKIPDTIYSGKWFWIVLISRVVLICIFLSLFRLELNFYSELTLALILALTMLISFRAGFIHTGATELTSITLFIICISSFFHSPAVISLGLCAIALQTIICYAVNGLVKAMERKWRSGEYLAGIAQTTSFSISPIRTIVSKIDRKYIGYVSVLVISFEIGFILTPFLPLPVLIGVLLIGIAFHLYNSIVMGLGTFFWVFIATYPAIIYLNQLIHQYLGAS